MARSRMIKPEFWDDEKLCRISRDARLTFIGLWTNSDDYGVVKGHPAWLKSQIFPYDDIKIQTFMVWIKELEDLRIIFPFTDNSENYIYIKNFDKHQVINRKSKSRNPTPPDSLIEDSMSTHGGLMDQTETEVKYKQKQKAPSAQKKSDAHTIRFEMFWDAYPKKVGKRSAESAWMKLNGSMPDIEIVLQKLEQLKKSEQWTADNGKWIPHPSTWLNRGGWDDQVSTEIYAAPQKTLTIPKITLLHQAFEVLSTSGPDQFLQFCGKNKLNQEDINSVMARYNSR